MHPGHQILALDDQAGIRGQAQGGVQRRAVLTAVDPLAVEQGAAHRAQRAGGFLTEFNAVQVGGGQRFGRRKQAFQSRRERRFQPVPEAFDQAPGQPWVHGLQNSETDFNDLRFSKLIIMNGKNLVENKMADAHWFVEAMERGAHLYFSKSESLEVVVRALAGL